MRDDELGERVLIARAGTLDQLAFMQRGAVDQAPTL
jgi:hypothetical protein